MTELERLRADLEVLERYERQNHGLTDAVCSGQDKIARLEAADPWREAKNILDAAKEYGGFAPTPKGFAVVVKFFDHLTAERDRLAARVAELEASNEPPFWPSEIEIQAIQPQDEKAIMDASVELMEGLGSKLDPDDFGNTNSLKFEIAANRTVKYTEFGPLRPRDVSAEINDVDDDPILDHARVLLTAIGILASEKEFRASASISDAMFRHGLSATKPYPLKGASE